MLSPDTVLAGRYRILSIVGEGRFGKVYLGHDLRSDRHVAIKELLPHSTLLSTEEWHDYRARFRKEAQAVSRVIHANVVSAYGLETDDNETMYLVLEYVDGKSLRQLLETESPLSIERALDIAIDICQAIEGISLRDIVHRDIKPDNILLTSQGAAKLTGFGVAQLGHEIHRTQPPLGHPGTPAYKSPEQATSTGCLEQRSDLYSLGLVMYEMLTGRRYLGDGRPPRHYDGDVPHALDAAVMKALAQRPAARYQTAGEMRRDLVRVRDQSTWGQLWVVLSRVCSRHNASIAATALVVGLTLSIFRLSAAVSRPVEADRRAVYAAQVPLEATATYPWTATPSMTPRPPAEGEALPSITPAVAGLRDVYEPDDWLP
ncbi:MAG TPA: serine/threonine-protein kinase, partial [Anaerolineae bacterium]|nr:serine/threonine-protein kinase [Anaerolineae bacterium]